MSIVVTVASVSCERILVKAHRALHIIIIMIPLGGLDHVLRVGKDC